MKNFHTRGFLALLFVLGLLFFAFSIRIWRVTEAPASVNWDEAALGYNAYSMLKTGRDEFGKAFPVSLRSFDDYKPALYSYLATVPIAFLDLGELATRLTSVIAGVILVFAVLYITAKLTGNFYLGLSAGLFTAVSPWAIHFSRIAFEANLASAIYFLAIAVFVWSLKKPKVYFISAALFILSLYAYHAQRAIALPTLFALTIIFKQKVGKAYWTGLLLLPLVYSFLTEPAGSRLTSTIILKLWPFAPSGFSQFIYNPIYSLVLMGAGQFMAYFSPATLFFKGSPEPILRIPTLGLLPSELLPLWLLGLLTLFNKSKLNRALWVVLLLAPLPGAVTWNWFSAIRTQALYPVFAILAAVGGGKLIELIKLNKLIKLTLLLCFGGIFALSSLYTVLTIGIYAPVETFGEFQPGFEQMVPYVMTMSKKYDQVVVDTGQATPYIFFLFYGKYPPRQYLAEARRDLKHTENYGYSFGKFVFRKIEDYELYKTNLLLVGQTNKLPDGEIEHIKKERNIISKDFYDLGGYISIRTVAL